MTIFSLPKYLFPKWAVTHQPDVEGAFLISNLKNQDLFLLPDSEYIEVQASGYQNEKKWYLFDVTLQANVSMRCERCHESVIVPINSKSKLVCVETDEAAKQLPEDYDPVMMLPGGKIDFYALIEEEFLLNLPLIPKHESLSCHADCFSLNATACSADREGSVKAETKNPFSILAQLKE